MEKKADCRRKKKNKAIRKSDRFKARYSYMSSFSLLDVSCVEIDENASSSNFGLAGGEGGAASFFV